MNANLEVMLEYKLFAQVRWREFPITARDYFDPHYASDDRRLDIDDVPLHDHAVEYLDIGCSLIENTRLTLRDDRTSEKRTIVETFWNGGNSRIIERGDERNGIETYYEMIIDSQLKDEPIIAEIVRIGRKDGVLIMFSHVIITTNPDGSQTEMTFYPQRKGSKPGDGWTGFKNLMTYVPPDAAR